MTLPQNEGPVKAPAEAGGDAPATPPTQAAGPALSIVPGAGAADRAARLQAHLQASGLEPADVPSWAVVRGKEAEQLCGAKLAGSAIKIPYLRLDGSPLAAAGVPFARLRLLDRVDQDHLKAKYLQPQATGAHVYTPAGFRSLLEGMDRLQPPPLVVTEGEKKAEAGCKHLGGIPVLGVGGVSMWSAPAPNAPKGAKKAAKAPRELHPELTEAIQAYSAIAGEKAHVIVLFDSDGRLLDEDERSSTGNTVHYRGLARRVEKRAVAEEAIRLAAAVRKLGVYAAPAWCPTRGDGKQGLDDWILSSTGAVVADALRGVECTDEKEERAADLAEKAKTFPLTPLGVSITGEELVLHTRDDTDAIVRLPVKDISHARLAGLLGSDYVEAHYIFPGEKSDIFDKTRAVGDLVKLCEAAGRWHDVRTRGPGVWVVDGRVLVSAIEGLYDAETGEIMRGADRLVRPSERNIYGQAPAPMYFKRVDYDQQKPWVSARPLQVIPRDDASPAPELLAWLQRWSYDRASSAKALAGWIAFATVGQALPRRPGVWVYGQAGSGKTTLAKSLRHLLHGGALFCSNGASGYTAIGLRQALQDTSMPVILDEAERPTGASALTDTGQRAVNTLEASLEAFRAGYSATAGDDAGAVLTNASGTPSGDAKITESHAVWAWLSISPPGNLRQSDQERLVLISINPLVTHNAAEPDAEHASLLGQRVRAWALRNVAAMQAAVEWVRNSGEAREVVPKARSRDTWGTLAAAWGVLLHGAGWAQHTGDILDALREIAQDQATSGDGQGVVPAHERLFADLLSAQVVLEKEDDEGRMVRKTCTIGHLLALAQPLTAGRRPDEQQELLMRHGVKKLSADTVFIAGSIPALKDLAKRAGHYGVDIDVILGQHPDAQRTSTAQRQRVGGGVKCSGVILPIPESVLEGIDD